MENFNWRRAFEIFVAEFLGTSALVLIGCAGVVYGMLFDFSPLLLSSVNFGIAIGLVIVIFGNISSHINPIITAVGIILEIIPLIYYPVYFLAQILGGIVGMSLLKLITPGDLFNVEETEGLNKTIPITPVCCTVPSPEITNMHAVGVEIMISFLLCLLFCSISDNRTRDYRESTPMKFGITIASLGLSFSSYTGASMNPARSFGPAVIHNYWKDHWVYWVGPFLGSILAAVLWKYVFFVRPVPSVIK